MSIDILKNNQNLNFGVIQITREFDGVKFIEGNLSKDQEMLAINAFRSSNPNSSVLLVTEENGNIIYQQFLGNSEKALVGVVVSSKENLKDNPVFYSEIQVLNNHIANLAENYDGEGHSLEFGLEELAEINDLNGLLFATLTAQPIIALGEENNIKRVLLTLLSLLPPEISTQRTILTHTDNFRDNIDFIGMPITKDTISSLAPKEDTHTLVNLNDKQVYALFECPLADDLASSVRSGDLNAIKQILEEIYTKAWKIKDINNPEDVSEATDLNKADAEFIFMVSSTLSKEPTMDFKKIR